VQVQGDAYLGRAQVAQRPGGEPVTEQQVMRGGGRGRGVPQPGGVLPVAVAVVGHHLRLTPADVAFTFNMVKANASINSGGLNISSVSTSGNTVTLTFPTPQYTNLEEIAGQAIVPKSQWTGVKPATFTDANPVGTGPYMLGSFTPQGFTLKKNPYYWQPADVQVPNVYFPVYTSNTGALTALYTGQIDWTGNYIPGLQKNFVDTDPATHGYWEAAGGDESLEPNLTKWPTNQLAVRQAISLAVNRTLLASEGEAGLATPISEAGGLTLPTFQAWAGPVASAAMPTTSNTAAAEQVLEKAGFTKGSNGYFEKGGKTVAVTIISPTAYTDMAEVDSIAAQELRGAGIDATYQGLSTDAWNADVADGDFSMTEHWSNGGISPVNMYNGWLNSALASGSAAVGDYERLSDPALNTDLATLAGATTVSQQATDLVPLEQYVAANLPVIPVTTAPEWFEYNSQNYTDLGRRILLAQVKDARRTPDGDWKLVLLGEGEVPVREMLGLLAADGYQGWISVEWEKRWHPEIAEPEVALPQHLSMLAEWMEVNL
jgi:peptide/nickel transport system substrate-binding protein